MLQTWPLKLTLMLSNFLKNQEQMRLKIGKKLKTASLTLDLPVIKKKSALRLGHF